MAMARQSALNPQPPEFDRFLQAWVGEDRNGFAVTVLSALARLGVDPWTETAELATLGRDAARARLGLLLARFQDVPSLSSDHGRVAQDLSQLLPEAPRSGPLNRTAATDADGRPSTGGAIWVALAISLALIQVFMAGGSGSGE